MEICDCEKSDTYCTWAKTTMLLKTMDDIGVVMTPFGDVVTVILVVNSYVFCKVVRGNDKN